MRKPTLTTWLAGIINDGIPQSVKAIDLRLTKEGEGWFVEMKGYAKASTETKGGEGESFTLSGEYPLQLLEKNTPLMEAVLLGRQAAIYLKEGSGRERLLCMEYINVVDSDGKNHLLYEKEHHKIHDPASSERRMGFLLILSFLAVLLPSFEPTMAIFGILLGLYGIWLTHGIYKKHRKARTAFVLDILAIVIGAWTLVMMLIATKGGMS